MVYYDLIFGWFVGFWWFFFFDVVCINCIILCNDYVICMFIECYVVNIVVWVFYCFGWKFLVFFWEVKLEYFRSCGNEECCKFFVCSELDVCDGFFWFENDLLFGFEIVNEIVMEYCYGVVCEVNCNLGKVIEGGESWDLVVLVGSNVCFIGMYVYWELFFCIINVDSV